MDTPFSDSGFNDATAGAELFQILRIDPHNLVFPQGKDDLIQIADFVNKWGDAIPRIRQAMNKLPNGADPLQHISQFVHLQNSRMELKTKLLELEKELAFYE